MRAADVPRFRWWITSHPEAASSASTASVEASVDPSSTTTISQVSCSRADRTASVTVGPSLKHGITTAARGAVRGARGILGLSAR